MCRGTNILKYNFYCCVNWLTVCRYVFGFFLPEYIFLFLYFKRYWESLYRLLTRRSGIEKYSQYPSNTHKYIFSRFSFWAQYCHVLTMVKWIGRVYKHIQFIWPYQTTNTKHILSKNSIDPKNHFSTFCIRWSTEDIIQTKTLSRPNNKNKLDMVVQIDDGPQYFVTPRKTNKVQLNIMLVNIILKSLFWCLINFQVL